MIVVRPIRISSKARAMWRERPGDRCIALQFREIRSGGCCSAGAAVSPLLMERQRLTGEDWIDLGEWDGVPVFTHRALLPFLESHPLEIDAGGLWPFRGLKLRSDVDIDMWCLFGDRPFAPPKPEWE
jgi:uncharacterized protein (DUF779 family)